MPHATHHLLAGARDGAFHAPYERKGIRWIRYHPWPLRYPAACPALPTRGGAGSTARGLPARRWVMGHITPPSNDTISGGGPDGLLATPAARRAGRHPADLPARRHDRPPAG